MKHIKLFEEFTVNKISCDNCGWEWKLQDGGDDLYICHECGHDNQNYDIADESKINEFTGIMFDLIGFDSNDRLVQKRSKRASNDFMKEIAKYGSENLFKSGKGVEYVKIYYDKYHIATVKDSGREIVKETEWNKLPISENY